MCHWHMSEFHHELFENSTAVTSLADKIPSGKVSLVQNSLKNMIYSSVLDPLRIIYLCLHSVHYSLGPFFNYVDKTR